MGTVNNSFNFAQGLRIHLYCVPLGAVIEMGTKIIFLKFRMPFRGGISSKMEQVPLPRGTPVFRTSGSWLIIARSLKCMGIPVTFLPWNITERLFWKQPSALSDSDEIFTNSNEIFSTGLFSLSLFVPSWEQRIILIYSFVGTVNHFWLITYENSVILVPLWEQ